MNLEKPKPQSLSTREKIDIALFRLRQEPEGIAVSDIARDPEVKAHLQTIFEKQQAIIIKHLDNEWYYLLLSEGEKPPKCPKTGERVQRWRWIK